MDIVQIWNDAVRNIVDTKENLQEKTIIQLFCAQVMLSIEDNKIHFFCNSMYIYNLFLPYVSSFYDEIKRIIGRDDFGIAIEIGSATMPGVTQPTYPGMPMQGVSIVKDKDTTSEDKVKEKGRLNTIEDDYGDETIVDEEEVEVKESVAVKPKSTIEKKKVKVTSKPQTIVANRQRSEDIFAQKNEDADIFSSSEDEDESVVSHEDKISTIQELFGDPFSDDNNTNDDEEDIQPEPRRTRASIANSKKRKRAVKATIEDEGEWADRDYHEDSESIFMDDERLGNDYASLQYRKNQRLNNHEVVKVSSRQQRSLKTSERANYIHSRFLKNDIINPLKTFDNYVTDPENKILYATAMAVAENPGNTSYNPLYMYGDSGLGKTHLLFAIANQIMQNNPSVKLLYTRAEKFIQHYVESMTTKQMHFQDVYTSYDVFIVDDIQGFVKAEKTRDAFFDIIAEFIDKPSKQLILASDVSPSELKGFSQRLTTRFGSGVCCEVIPPSSETRMAIILQKCQELDIQFSNDVIQYIANNIRTNVREIEGAIKTLNTRRDVFNSEITLEQAELALSSIINNTNSECSIDYIKQVVSAEFGVAITDMESASRKKAVSLARSMSMALIRELIPTSSLAEIGRAFNKDHSSVHEAINRITKKMNQDHDLAVIYKRLGASLKKD